MKKQFIISTDSCCDHYKSFLDKHNVYCIILRRIVNGKELVELYDSAEEFDRFYDEIKNGVLPKTTMLNSTELKEYFESILKVESQGDIIHLSLSSGLSGSYNSAVRAAEEINKTLDGRKVYIVDSLIATHGMSMLVDKMMEMRDTGAAAKDTIKKIEEMRDNQHAWIIMSDLFHLKRGGRIGGFQATIGTALGVKPIVHVNNEGKLAIENKMRGAGNAIEYILTKMDEFGVNAGTDFSKQMVYFIRTSKSKLYDDMLAAALKKYPKMKYTERIVGPIIGTHLGCGGVVTLFEGAKRLDIKAK
jgi:DegV family protein with EDD domain